MNVRLMIRVFYRASVKSDLMKQYQYWLVLSTCMVMGLTFSTLQDNLADDMLKYFSFFPRKQGLAFHSNYLIWRQFE